VTEPRSRRIALGTGLTYHVLEWGAPTGAPVLLLHGFLDLAWGWDAMARRLAARLPARRLVAPDLRGHGDSDRVGAGGYYHFFDYVADVDALVERYGGALDLVGHSMGGSIAGYYAGARPDCVRRLALLEGQGPPDQAGVNLPDRTVRWMESWRELRRAAPRVMPSLDDAAARLQKHDARLTLDDARALARHGTYEVDGGVVWKHDPLHATMGPYAFRLDSAETFWKRISAPVLVIDAAESRMRLPDAEAARRRGLLASSRHVMLPDAGHMLQRHQPDAVANLLAEHLA
jgi:pimeloyl-ACP methyl ester carboxylesterase